MQQITAPEILWRIFSLVESNADLARAGRLNKFIGAAALDVLWNDIHFKNFLSLFPTHITRVQVQRRRHGYWSYEEEHTNIVVPLLPNHWQKVNPYARRVKSLRHSDIAGMEQILTSLKVYDRGSETPCIFPRLRRLIWDGFKAEELPLIANLFFHPTLKEISIRNYEYLSSRDQSQDTPTEDEYFVSESSLSVPFSIISACRFPALTRLYLPIPTTLSESLDNYHTATIHLLCCLEWQLKAAGVMFSRDILHLLGTFPKLHSLELYDVPIDPSDLRALEDEDDTPFKNLRSLTIRNLRSSSSLTYLEYSQCIPSHRMKVIFSRAFGDHLSQHHGFYQIIHLLSRKATLESLEMEGTVDLTVFLESLLALSNLKELILGPGVTFNIGDDMLRLMSIKWRNLSRLSVDRNQANMVSLNGIASLRRCPIQFLRLSFTLTRNDITNARRGLKLEDSEISPLHSLKHFYLTGLVNTAGGDIAGTVLALAYLFPRAQFVYEFTTEPSDTTVQEVLRIRQVVLELLQNPDIVGLSQIQGS